MQDIPQTQSKNIDIKIMRKNTIVFEPFRRTYLKNWVLTIRKKRDWGEEKKYEKISWAEDKSEFSDLMEFSKIQTGLVNRDIGLWVYDI